jgi:GH35 family endo-1,4-beta-xylanase
MDTHREKYLKSTDRKNAWSEAAARCYASAEEHSRPGDRAGAAKHDASYNRGTSSHSAASDRSAIYHPSHDQAKPPNDARKSAEKSEDTSTKSTGTGGNNMLTSKFELEGKPGATTTRHAKDLVHVLTQDERPDGTNMKIAILGDIHQGEPITLSQPIKCQFQAKTELQKQFQAEHPNLDLGHIVHLHFRAKSDQGNKMMVQIMGAEPPYKQSMSERIDLSNATSKKDPDGFTTYDFYSVVPSTAAGGKLNFKLSLGQEQQKGQIEIQNLTLNEVQRAPGLDPVQVIKTYDGETTSRAGRSFMLGVNANHLVDANTRMDDGQLNAVVQKAQADHPGDLEKQLREVNVAKAQFVNEHKFSTADKEKYFQEIKAMGVNTITIPVYWDQIEGERGRPNYSQVDHVIELAQKYGMHVKLHPVVWADCYPTWVDKEYAEAKQKNPQLTATQYTEDVIRKHLKDTLNHFGKTFGNEISAVEINEMSSTELLQHPTRDVFGRAVTNDAGQTQYEQVHNGLTDWIHKDGVVAVVNKVDEWIRQDLASTSSLKNTKLFENEYFVDNQTNTNDQSLSRDAHRPDAFGIEAHQFNGQFLALNENDPLLAISQKLQSRKPNTAANYISELTVETTPAPHFDESKMSPEVKEAETKREQDFQRTHNQAVLPETQRKAEEQQAEELLAWYKTALNNKNTIGITLWDGSEKNAWNGNTGGPLDANNDPKISYYAIQEYLQRLRIPSYP